MIISLLSTLAFADEGKTTIGLTSKQYFAGMTKNGVFKYANSSPTNGRLNNAAIISYNRLKFNFDAKSDKGFKYGGLIRLRADNNQSNMADRTMVYIEGLYGRIEAGSYASASYNMRVNASTIAKGSGGPDGDAQNFLPSKDFYGQDFTQRYFVYGDLLMENSNMSTPNKVTYITPQYNGLQAAVSFTPDTAVTGTTASLASQDATDTVAGHYKNMAEAIVKYTHKLGDLTITPAFRLQNGQAKYTNEIDRDNPNAWEASMQLAYGKYKLAGAYEDFRKSGAVISGNRPNVKAGGHGYNLGVAYESCCFQTSLTYMQTKRANLFSKNAPDPQTGVFTTGYNKFELVSLGVDYKIAEGLVWYNEANLITTKAATKYGEANAPQSFKSFVGISGLKLSF